MSKDEISGNVSLNGKRVIIVDKFIVSWSGHWMQYAVDLGELFHDRGARIVLGVNKLFGKGAFKGQQAELEKLSYQPQIVRYLHQPAFYKKRHPYEKLKRKRYTFGEKISRRLLKPGSATSVLFYTLADYRLGNFKSPQQFISFFTKDTNPLTMIFGGLFAAIGIVLIKLSRTPIGLWLGRTFMKVEERAKVKDEAKQQKKKRDPNSLIDRFKFTMKQIGGYRRLYASLNPGAEDLVVFQTADQSDLVALTRVIGKNPRWTQAHHKLILRTPIWDQDGNFSEAPEESKLVRKTLLDLMNIVSRLDLYVDTEEMADQYRSLGFVNVGVIPILYGKGLEDTFEAIRTAPLTPTAPGQRLNVIRSGNAQREKGFLVLPDLLKAAQIERQRGGPNLGFIIQATLLRYQPRWDRLIATMARLRWFADGDLKLITQEVSTPDYVKNLVESDIVISPNRSIPYIHGSTGTTLEALRASKPLVTLGDNWGARQLRNLDVYVDHLVEFARENGIQSFDSEIMVDDMNAFDVSPVDFQNTWDPFCNVQPWQISLNIARRFALRVPKNATHIAIIMKNGNQMLPGDVAKIGIQSKRNREALIEGRRDRHAFQYIDTLAQNVVWRPFGAEREVTANLWKLASGTEWIFGGLILLDKRCSIANLSLEIVFCDNAGNKVPTSAAGVIADNVLELAEGMFEVGRHFDHYQKTAQVGGEEIKVFHNRQTFWTQFVEKTPGF